MKIKSIRLTKKLVSISYENANEDHELSSQDRPLQEFFDAVEGLRPLILHILHLPEDYGATLTPTGLTLADKQDVQLVCLVAKKDLPECHSPFNIATPLRFLEHPKEEGTYSPALMDEHVALVQKVIDAAKAYIQGNRAQGTLPLGDDKDAQEDSKGDDAQDDLDLPGAKRTSQRK